MSDEQPRPFRFDAEVAPGEKRQFRYEVSETYLGDSVEIPVTVVNGGRAGPRVFMTAASSTATARTGSAGWRTRRRPSAPAS